MEERRANRRYSVSLKAQVINESANKIYDGKVTDISFAGVRFVCAEEVVESKELELVLFIEGQEVRLKAVVIWSAELEGLPEIQHGMRVVGVAFVSDGKKLEDFFKKIQAQ